MVQSSSAIGEGGAAKLEFGGVPGNLALILGLPIFTAWLYFCWRWNGGALLPGPEADWEGFCVSLWPTPRAAALYAGWFGLQVALQRWAPGRVGRGAPLADGRRLDYELNGPASALVTLALAAALHASGALELRVLHDEFGALLTLATLWAFALASGLFVFGLRRESAGRRSGNTIHDFWMGAVHNPRPSIAGRPFDLKFFCEARPGLLLWVLIDLAMLQVQWERYGFVSTSMILVCAFQFFYVADYFVHEPAILTTMDIRHENFGFMLVFGDLVWVPFTYCLQAAWLIDHVHHLPLWATGLAVAVNALGFYVFRAVNLQKHRFREDPEGARIWGRPAEYLETAAGRRLLTSGFWGWSRHFNYVGDIGMAVSWSLPCLFGSALPWFYPIYFAGLLLHRERRDHRLCARKYGADWERYCKRVRWRIVPGIY